MQPQWLGSPKPLSRFENWAMKKYFYNHYFLKAEIDAACELADFFRFNCFFAKELMKYQPISEDPSSVLNLMRYRPLEGFIASVTPFNFTAIAGNLAYTPCIMVSSQLLTFRTL